MRGHDHRDHDTGAPLMPFDEARSLALARIEALAPHDVELREALGFVAAEAIRAPHDLPPFTSSAMDGFAVRARDVDVASRDRPAALRLAGRVEMGAAAEVSVGAGEAVAIPTGAVVPEGADAVVPIERCIVKGDRVLMLEASAPGRFGRPAGQDVRAGEVLVEPGRRLGPPEVGLLASAGIPTVRVHPKARVAIVSTGDELVEVGRTLGPGQVHDANAATLHA
ncbi:MAG TPA: molybdopterin molybdotransferase MoeA, partial [Actinomycetota bacterium]|nr:molybdopterin molybdotransferase MoeA [Actinomycetota bacterium]